MTSSGTVNDEEWAQAEGVPNLSDPFIQKYLQGRDALVQQEKRQRSGWSTLMSSDYLFRQNLSPMAQEACAIVSQIRFEEQQTLWTKEYEDSLLTDHVDVFPGMMFSLAKDRMEKSKLWQIVKKMPKGTLLHCHLEAMVDLDWVLQEAFDTAGVCVIADGPITDDKTRRKTGFSFTYSKDAKSDTSIWNETYAANTPIPVNQAADSFPDGGKKAFIEWVRSRVTITASEHLSHHEGPNEVWRKFMSCFPILGSLIYYEPIFRKFIRNMCKQLLDDGVYYVDMRSAFYTPYRSAGKEKWDDDWFHMLEHTADEIEKFKASEEGKEFWGARIIWTTIRQFGKKEVIESMKQCIEMKLEFPEIIAGYDLVGQEDLGRPLSDLAPELFWFRKACAQEGVDIPFFFHAGETLGDGDSVDENLFDAIILGTRRIGHGFSLYKHPLLIDMVKEKRILVESCPVSNEVLRLCGSIMSHPLPALLARGVPCSLCNDDPTILGQGKSGMSHDFWQALQGWENLGLEGLGSLAENSVRWASLDDYSAKDWTQDIKDGMFGKGIRAQRLKEWVSKWEKFCAWIVEEYGVDENLEPEE
ncbi:adenosine deaminase family protein [Pyrenophora tritici-repentis Pt-1C-BFP]|uniref:adenosine deaminase n=1 Tax=Pyrenophora tritici-repentis (strain Pt-1C-BFP) TaxID=426418 RepID=B2W4D1_PYRTR|nr:adenosine deaminase family protein [Pyrenophora tritici-repentis Pt-1C-BFP]EDU47388.1 adenosine deaminase family protein [Pyrenophora tritici-repentis Pt-1C-BFP]